MRPVDPAASRRPAAQRLLQSHRTWLAVFIVLVTAVCTLAFMPAPPRELSTGWDKLNHALAFASLTFAARMAFPRRSLWAVVLGLLAIGGFIEIVQLYVPGRSCDWEDLFADSVGIALGLLIVWWPLRACRLPATES